MLYSDTIVSYFSFLFKNRKNGILGNNNTLYCPGNALEIFSTIVIIAPSKSPSLIG